MTDAEEQTRTDCERTDDPPVLDPLVEDLFRNLDCLPSAHELDQRSIREMSPDIVRRVRACLDAADAETDSVDWELSDPEEGTWSAEFSGETEVPGDDANPQLEEMIATMRDDLGSTREVSLPAASLTAAEAPLEAEASEITALEQKVQTFYRNGRIGRRGYVLRKLLGVGGQGRVYVTRCGGADGFRLRGALKIFSPRGYGGVAEYETAMRRIALVARRVAQGRHPNLVEIRRFEKSSGVRLMLMELLDGYDLRRLLNPRLHEYLQLPVPEFANPKLLDEFNRVLVTAGRDQPRMMPGAAVALIRDCLSALQALHEMNILHFDIKPSNIMVTPRGYAKLIDLGSAIYLKDPGKWQDRIFTPAYAAPEVLKRKEWTARSDLASLGYVLVELMAGTRLFRPDRPGAPRLTRAELLERKRALPDRLDELFPEESKLLLQFCRKLIAFDPADRFATARQADSDPTCGAAAFQKQLVWGRLDAIWPLNIQLWIKTIKSFERRDSANRAGTADQ